MNSIIILFVLLILVTLFHLAFLVKTFVQFSFHWLLLEPNNIKYPKFNPSTDRLRTLITLLLFFSPLFIFKAYRNLAIENITINITVLVILTSITCLSLYTNKYKIWSKSFRTSPNKFKKDNLIISIEKKIGNLKNSVNQNNVLIITNERKINNLKYSINQSKKQITDNERSLVNLRKNKNQISEKVSYINKDILKIESNVEQLNSNILSKQQKIKKKENKSFKEYFKSDELFQATIAALEENNFFNNKSEITPTNVSILVAMLKDLDFIKIRRDQKYLCIALEKYFKIDKVDPSILSNTLKDFRDESTSSEHQYIYERYKYLDKLNQA